MARLTCKKGAEAKAIDPQAMRGKVLTRLESLGYDPKPVDLCQGKVKSG